MLCGVLFLPVDSLYISSYDTVADEAWPYPYRSVLKSFTNPSPSSTASIPSAVLVSKNGSRGKSLKPLPRNRILSLAHHAEHWFGIPDRMPVSLRFWRCISRPIRTRPGHNRTETR